MFWSINKSLKAWKHRIFENSVKIPLLALKWVNRNHENYLLGYQDIETPIHPMLENKNFWFISPRK